MAAAARAAAGTATVVAAAATPRTVAGTINMVTAVITGTVKVTLAVMVAARSSTAVVAADVAVNCCGSCSNTAANSVPRLPSRCQHALHGRMGVHCCSMGCLGDGVWSCAQLGCFACDHAPGGRVRSVWPGKRELQSSEMALGSYCRETLRQYGPRTVKAMAMASMA
mmetsp:Transcript_25656/g.65146  ORF Transcript_25656/g.65146 Transcript_25656/m.65146 type:complete len:167 (+) Transcript_25656:2293-2793(+)